MAKICFVPSPVHSSTLLCSCVGTPVCFSKLGACWPSSTVGNTLTMDKHLIQPNFKNTQTIPLISRCSICDIYPTPNDLPYLRSDVISSSSPLPSNYLEVQKVFHSAHLSYSAPTPAPFSCATRWPPWLKPRISFTFWPVGHFSV